MKRAFKFALRYLKCFLFVLANMVMMVSGVIAWFWPSTMFNYPGLITIVLFIVAMLLSRSL